jgi:hypothetical protein
METHMDHRDLAREADQCRAQAAAFSGAEGKLLLRIAKTFDRIASAEEARLRIAATRCW